MEGALAGMPNLRCTEPLGYLDFLCLMDHARVVLTDSGGIQEETTALGVPCLTLRENTERPITVDRGTNQLVGTRPEASVAAIHAATRPDAFVAERMPDLWDGKAAERIVDILLVREGNVGPTLRKGLPS
jgi:UDP-N-acetylglucosamine 2-epimerase (non-hydrolysing)